MRRQIRSELLAKVTAPPKKTGDDSLQKAANFYKP
jgi:hypothetical protein